MGKSLWKAHHATILKATKGGINKKGQRPEVEVPLGRLVQQSSVTAVALAPPSGPKKKRASTFAASQAMTKAASAELMSHSFCPSDISTSDAPGWPPAAAESDLRAMVDALEDARAELVGSGEEQQRLSTIRESRRSGDGVNEGSTTSRSVTPDPKGVSVDEIKLL